MPVPRVGAALAMPSWTCWTAAHIFGWFGSGWFPVHHPGRPPREHARRLSCNIRTAADRGVQRSWLQISSIGIRYLVASLWREFRERARFENGSGTRCGSFSRSRLHVCIEIICCFGLKEYGECDVPTDLGPVVAVSAGYDHTCAVRSDGQLVCFGWNRNGQCHKCGQCDVPTDLGPVVAVSAGCDHTCAVRSDGQLV